MSQYLLSTYMVQGEVPGAPDPAQMQAFMQRVMALEEEMEQSGAFVFGGALHGPDASTVVRHGDGEVLMTDGSIQFISDTIDFIDLKRLACRRDGEPITTTL